MDDWFQLVRSEVRIMASFLERTHQRIQSLQSVLCVGLDSAPEKIPDILKTETDPQLAFNRKIIDVTKDLACCYKPNLAFYVVRGADGIQTLKETIEYAHEADATVILDAKFGDIGHTAEFYARFAFEELQADAVTLNPYMGEESITPFRAYPDRASFILCLTSNVSRSDFQTRLVSQGEGIEAPLFHLTAETISRWNGSNNLGAVAGATAPEELSKIREILGPSIPILSPGVGAQGGDLEEVLWAGYTEEGGLLINVSRAILNASSGPDFAEAARQEAEMFVNQIKEFLVQFREG